MRCAASLAARVTANGNYLTKQSAGIYSTEPAAKPFRPRDPSNYQAAIDNWAVVEVAEGEATVETYTVMHEREKPSCAILFGRLRDDRRFIANTPNDVQILQALLDYDLIGAWGELSTETPAMSSGPAEGNASCWTTIDAVRQRSSPGGRSRP